MCLFLKYKGRNLQIISLAEHRTLDKLRIDDKFNIYIFDSSQNVFVRLQNYLTLEKQL